MNNYKFIVSKYRAIQNATIINEGITIISGENGCGKSTFSRMLYYMINIMCNFTEFVYQDSLHYVKESAGKLYDALIQTTHQPMINAFIRNKLKQLSESKNFEELEVNLLSMLEEYKPYLIKFFNSENDSKKRERILDYLGVNNFSGSSQELTDACVESVKKSCYKILTNAQENIDTKKKNLLINYIHIYGTDLFDFPKDIKFQEDDVNLITSKNFSIPLSINRAIYIDTPMAVNDNLNYSTSYWKNLLNLLNREEVEGTKQERKLRHKLHCILHGDIKVEKDRYTKDSKLRYIREDGLGIDLVNAATGIKSFAYLQRLLANGLLRDDTLLIIDEPEAHLHPQWIVEFAKVLVKLNKELGVKVMITSHNPDMVAAIQKISNKEGVLERTHFYLAERSQKNLFRYDYRDLGHNIGPIFESFNIALTRIEEYGSNSNI